MTVCKSHSIKRPDPALLPDPAVVFSEVVRDAQNL